MMFYQAFISLDFHQLALTLLIVASTVSILIIVARGLSHEFEALALDWIRIFKNLRAEWRKPTIDTAPAQPPQLIDHTRTKRDLS